MQRLAVGVFEERVALFGVLDRAAEVNQSEAAAGAGGRVGTGMGRVRDIAVLDEDVACVDGVVSPVVVVEAKDEGGTFLAGDGMYCQT